MKDARLLIVDDEESIRFILERTLRQEAGQVDLAADGQTAIEMLRTAVYDLILLDLNMTPVDGLAVLNAARQQDPDAVVIILTGQGSLESAVEALRLGAFDYLFKPANPQEIRERVQAGLRQRRQAVQRQQILEQIEALRHTLSALDETITVPREDGRFLRSGPLVIDRHHRAATFNDKRLDLTTAEFDLLVCLVEASPNPISPVELTRHALGYEAEEIEARDTIKWHIHHLRRKVEPTPNRPQHIKTVRYKGYFWSS
ncbi:MAG: response regulator transcription factor [Anaerolineae bacterium]